MYKDFGINEELEKLANRCEEDLKDIFEDINKDALYNSKRVLMEFQKNKVSDMHFGTTTGYGEGDVRKKCDRKNFCWCSSVGKIA